MKLKIRTIEDMLYDGAEAEVYKGIIRKREIGRIGMIANVDTGYFKIEYFRVRQAERGKGIGRRMLLIMLEEMKKVGGTQIIVYPNSEPYENDKYIEPKELYVIYECLGFEMENKKADRNRPNNKMILNISKVSV